MRRVVFLLGPIVAVALLFACEDSGSSSSGDLPDATSGETGSPDGSFPPVDGSTAPDSAPPGPTVTVQVLSGGVAEANITVLFHDTTGTVLETKVTGADGKAASTPGMNPAQASALLGGGNVHHILTWTAVESGDVLFANDVGTGAEVGKYIATLPGSLDDAGETSATADVGSCTGTAIGGTVLVSLTADCVSPTTSILARAIAPIAGPTGATSVVGYAYGKGKSAGPTDGGSANVTLGAWMFPSTTTITPANVPVGAAFASLQEVSDNLALSNTTGGNISAASGKASFLVAPGFATAYQASVLAAPDGADGSTLVVAKRVAAPALDTVIDFATPLPLVNTAALVMSDAKRPQVFWSTVDNKPLTVTDGGIISVQWTNTGTDDAHWTFIVPPSVKSVAAPKIPATFDAWLPQAPVDGGGGSSFTPTLVTFVEADTLASYAELRGEIGRIVALGTSADIQTRAVLPANGTLRLTSFQNVPR
jgi:hypothetical protein